ncbi:hypothetical protein AYI69_g4849 [Smittium culicis]|uniref:Tyr recombinase domain-containing protein n=1 Tax=Smittium culicis TaxID=133412 RepID=A0A1R1YA64_9FUNG|nr:hypothetical protein AYI69_g4849 [Smittium culicis]
MFVEFMRTSNERSTKSFVRHKIDNTPILGFFRLWEPTTDLIVKQLTSKLCWLLAVTGFLRASDIHTIDNARSRTENGELNLVIVTPKENRGGQPVEKSCLITSHTDSILFPVVAYKVYKKKLRSTSSQHHMKTTTNGL